MSIGVLYHVKREDVCCSFWISRSWRWRRARDSCLARPREPCACRTQQHLVLHHTHGNYIELRMSQRRARKKRSRDLDKCAQLAGVIIPSARARNTARYRAQPAEECKVLKSQVRLPGFFHFLALMSSLARIPFGATDGCLTADLAVV